MREQDIKPKDPREELIELLSIDLRSDEEKALDQEPEDTFAAPTLSTFLLRSRAIEDIQARFESEECAELAVKASQLLESTSITESFKGLIVGYLVQAYAYEKKVDEIVSPTSLGIVGGEGIFDAEASKEIEARALRGYLFDIINKQVLVARNEETDEPVAIVRNRDAYDETMGFFDAWTLDFIGTYGEDVFAGIELDDYYIDAATQAHLVTEEEAEESGWADIVNKLRKLREDDTSV